MHMTLTTNDWLLQNALFCNRLHARITLQVCEENRAKSDDLRCEGCTGLEDQERGIPRKEPVVFFSEPSLEDREVVEASETDGSDTFDSDEPYVEPVDDDLEGELLSLLEDDFEELIPEPAIKQNKCKQVAVFMGRCPICDGYMVNAPEQQYSVRDEEVYRCFCCGFRTSPSYEWNRRQRI
jgi:hypothetical protein